MQYIGVDLHKRSFTAAYKSGEDVKLQSFKMDNRGLEEFKRTISREDSIAVETTGNSMYFVDEIADCVKEIQIVNTRQFKIIRQSAKKTDNNDAMELAKYLEKGLLATVRYQAKDQRDLKSLIVTRDKLVKMRSSLKNKLHGLLLSNGIDSKKEQFSSRKQLEKLMGTPGLSEANRFELKILVEQLESLGRSIKELEQKIIDEGKDMKGQSNLQSIKGIGKLSSTILLNAIGDVRDFESSRKLSSYTGMVPKVYNSGGQVNHGRITKRGNKILRTTLVQVTLIAIRYSPYLRSYFVKKKHLKGSGKAIISTARKMLDIIYNTLSNDWVFKDFPNFVLAE